NPDEAVPSFVSGAMAKAGKGLLEGTLQAGTSAVSDKLLDLVGLRKIILIKQELLLLVYELNRSGLLAENEKIRRILAQLEKLLLCDLSPSTNDSVKN